MDEVVNKLRILLIQMPKGQQSVFCSNDEHLLGSSFDEEKERMKAQYLSNQMEKALNGTEFSNMKGFHLLRHTLASLMLADGYSKQEIKETIGWCTDEMADRYSHITSNRKRSLLELTFGTETSVEV